MIQEEALKTEIVQRASNEKLHAVLHDRYSLVYKMLEVFQERISKKDFLCYCADRSFTLKIDSLQIKQAIGNLLKNTIHFSPKKQRFSSIGTSSRTMYC